MNAIIGSAGVYLGLCAALAGVGTYAFALTTGRPALVRSARVYVWMVVGAAVAASFAMERALLTHDFSLQFVADNHSRSTPLLYTISTMWSRLQGSILLWTLILAGFLAAMARRFRDRAHDPVVGWAMLVGLAVAAFFFGLMAGPANPFHEVTGVIPLDGPGPNPLLQNHPLMAFHPPVLYLGYVGFTVPFAFAIAALVTGRLGEGWLVETRRWTLIAWGFLTLGIALGAWWSYEVLGWGGFWAWDPVENASFLPWLTGTAYLHSVMVQERRGMLRVWNLSLLCATFSLTILGTFLTRSGVLDSVHAFTEGSVGPAILAFFGVIVVVWVGLIFWRGDALRSPGAIDSPVSREGAFLINNLLFAAFAFVVLLGTVFPLVTEAVNGERITVGRPYFDRMTGPIGLALLFLMAIAPALPWRKAAAETMRERLLWPAMFAVAVVVALVLLDYRGVLPLAAFGLGAFAGGAAVRQLLLATRRHGWRGLVGRANGGMIVHLGVVLVAIGFAASAAYAHRTEVSLAEGQTVRIAGHRVTYLGTTTTRNSIENPVAARIGARLRIDGGKVFEPKISQYRFASQGIGTPSVKTGLVDDVYTTLVGSPEVEGGPATIGVLVQPMMLWLWIGGGMMFVGTFFAAFPTKGQRRSTDAASRLPGDRDARRAGAREPGIAATPAAPARSKPKVPASVRAAQP